MGEPTKQQARAIASRAHALEIRAGAGTGKTTTLAWRLARLAAEGTPEHRLLAVTFSRAAAASVQRAVGTLLGKRHGVRVATFHQWAAHELAAEAPRFISQDDARRALLAAMPREGVGGLARALGAARAEDLAARVQGFVSYLRNAETTVGEAIRRQFPALARYEDELVEVERRYQERKGERLDFDDLLLRFRDRLRDASFRRGVIERLDHLAVDEYQDVNGAQAESVRLLTVRRGVPVTVVGDPRQAIYGFRGGSPGHLERFLEPYGRRGARVALTVCFRSTRGLVAAGNAVLPDAHPLRARPRARRGVSPVLAGFADADSEARFVLDRIGSLAAEGVQPGDLVVLCRSRPLAAAYAAQRSERGGLAAESGIETIHAAKGLEWDHVVLLGAREGGLPGEQALRARADAREALLAEERRLLYVAATRARLSLTITWTGEPSRWLAPLRADAGAARDAEKGSSCADARVRA